MKRGNYTSLHNTFILYFTAKTCTFKPLLSVQSGSWTGSEDAGNWASADPESLSGAADLCSESVRMRRGSHGPEHVVSGWRGSRLRPLAAETRRSRGACTSASLPPAAQHSRWTCGQLLRLPDARSTSGRTHRFCAQRTGLGTPGHPGTWTVHSFSRHEPGPRPYFLPAALQLFSPDAASLGTFHQVLSFQKRPGVCGVARPPALSILQFTCREWSCDGHAQAVSVMGHPYGS